MICFLCFIFNHSFNLFLSISLISRKSPRNAFDWKFLYTRIRHSIQEALAKSHSTRIYSMEYSIFKHYFVQLDICSKMIYEQRQVANAKF